MVGNAWTLIVRLVWKCTEILHTAGHSVAFEPTIISLRVRLPNVSLHYSQNETCISFTCSPSLYVPNKVEKTCSTCFSAPCSSVERRVEGIDVDLYLPDVDGGSSWLVSERSSLLVHKHWHFGANHILMWRSSIGSYIEEGWWSAARELHGKIWWP